jgi:hypothetical protein
VVDTLLMSSKTAKAGMTKMRCCLEAPSQWRSMCVCGRRGTHFINYACSSVLGMLGMVKFKKRIRTTRFEVGFHAKVLVLELWNCNTTNSIVACMHVEQMSTLLNKYWC